MIGDMTAPTAAYVFELDSGRPCLDFANTLSADGTDHLNSYADLVAFAEQSHFLTQDDADWLRAEGARDSVTAEGVLVRARRLRTSIAAMFEAIAQGKRPSEHDVELLNFDLSTSLSHARVLPDTDGAGYHWGWTGRNLNAPVWPIGRSAADLLTSAEDRGLVRQCGADDCRWLFLDTSKNRTRQWCSMRSCGNRQKARRHYRRLRDKRVLSA
jgi:predicted RNA-binding Zn ribbon-like protein